MRALLLLPAAALPVLAACGGTPTTQLHPLAVTAVPWGPQEEARYLIANRQGQEAGRATFTLQQQREGPPGAPHEIADFVGTPPGPGGMGKNAGWLLRQRYQGPAATDEISLATGADLLPRRMVRVVEDKQGKLRVEALYSRPTYPGSGPFAGATVAITWRSGDEQRRRQLPLPPQTYDNGVSLFLWRTIPFAPGYASTYHSLTAILRVERPRRVSVRLRVVGKEMLEVPAGRWEAWRVQVQAPDRRHTAWYAVAGSHPLLQYDSGTHLFRLESLAPGP